VPSKEECEYRAANVSELAQRFELVVSGPAMRAALASDAATASAMSAVRVFARMTPADKEQLLRWRRAEGAFTMMCGDGANDVGALKQAHVGLALLSGFGTANTTTSGEKPLHEQNDEERVAAAKAVQTRARDRAAAIKADRAAMTADLQRLQQVYYQEELARLEAAGE
jgi:cation-transporting ATPase 13A1